MLLCIIVSLQAVPILPQARIGVPRLEQPQCCSPDPLGTQVGDGGGEGGDEGGEEGEDLNDICTVTCI